MKKTLLIILICCCLVVPVVSVAGNCYTIGHDWAEGPFWLLACGNWECPDYYSPNALIKVKHCTKCGLIRLPENLKKETGNYIRRDE